MKKMILFSLLAISAGQLYGAALHDEEALESLLTAIGDLDIAEVKKLVDAHPELINADNSIFSPLGIAQNLAETGGDPRDELTKAQGRKIAALLKEKGASKIVDTWEEYKNAQRDGRTIEETMVGWSE